MTKDQFLARCANAFDAGLITPQRRALLEKWLDAVMRLEGGQLGYFAEFLEAERDRTENFNPSRVLASDPDGYALIRFAAILSHHCQTCATDPKAWWTRSGFCNHSESERRGHD